MTLYQGKIPQIQHHKHMDKTTKQTADCRGRSIGQIITRWSWKKSKDFQENSYVKIFIAL